LLQLHDAEPAVLKTAGPDRRRVLDSPVRGSMCPAASPMISKWSSCVAFSPWPPRRRAAARMRSSLALGPSAAEMKGSCGIASVRNSQERCQQLRMGHVASRRILSA
jgi:hypothetical protein